MNDRELLELAAKDAGIEIIRWAPNGPVRHDAELKADVAWNPLASWGDGDALRLAVKLDLKLEAYPDRVWAIGYGCRSFVERDPDDKMAAMRRCVVKAAASMVANE